MTRTRTLCSLHLPPRRISKSKSRAKKRLMSATLPIWASIYCTPTAAVCSVVAASGFTADDASTSTRNLSWLSSDSQESTTSSTWFSWTEYLTCSTRLTFWAGSAKQLTTLSSMSSQIQMSSNLKKVPTQDPQSSKHYYRLKRSLTGLSQMVTQQWTSWTDAFCMRWQVLSCSRKSSKVKTRLILILIQTVTRPAAAKSCLW